MAVTMSGVKLSYGPRPTCLYRITDLFSVEGNDSSNARPDTSPVGSETYPRASRSEDAPDLITFEFQGVQHTIELLTSRSSTHVVITVDGVTHRWHVTLVEGAEWENWLDDTELIEFAKQTIDPNYG
jgi:hypothetical protein